MPKAEDQLYVSMPPGVAAGERFSALLADGRELVVTAPPNLPAGEQMLITVPAFVAGSTAKAKLDKMKAIKAGVMKAPKLRPEASAEAREAHAAAAAARRARMAVYGISYRQIEQYIIARYGVCANGRLMGSLAAAVRAGRMTREGKMYQPTGSMLAPALATTPRVLRRCPRLV